MKYFSHLNSAVDIIEKYNGQEPFSLFIKKIFSANKKYGSSDRRNITALCYAYFRMGHAASHLDTAERMLTGFFLSESRPSALLENLKPGWNESINISLAEKLQLTGNNIRLTDIFPWKENLGPGMDHELFCASFLRQPLLFIRARPGFEQAVQNKLKQAGIEFTLTRTGTLSMPNGTKAEQLLDLDKEAVIQDLSSQKTAAFMEDCKGPVNPSVWDCCAASGGKSILLTDVFQQQLSLAVSDIRPGILKNLRERFRKAGINNYRVFTADLSREAYPPAAAKYDLVVCDAPCSGSGTWARTPDQLCFFTKEKAESYASLQKKIIANAFSSVKPGGCFLYITCSVFRMENEAAVDYIKEKFQPGLIRLELIKGYESGADTMFAALFRK